MKKTSRQQYYFYCQVDKDDTDAIVLMCLIHVGRKSDYKDLTIKGTYPNNCSIFLDSMHTFRIHTDDKGRKFLDQIKRIRKEKRDVERI